MLARALVLGPLLLYALVAFAGSVLALARPLPLPARGSDVARSAHGVRALRAGAVVGPLGSSFAPNTFKIPPADRGRRTVLPVP